MLQRRRSKVSKLAIARRQNVVTRPRFGKNSPLITWNWNKTNVQMGNFLCVSGPCEHKGRSNLEYWTSRTLPYPSLRAERCCCIIARWETLTGFTHHRRCVCLRIIVMSQLRPVYSNIFLWLFKSVTTVLLNGSHHKYNSVHKIKRHICASMHNAHEMHMKVVFFAHLIPTMEIAANT